MVDSLLNVNSYDSRSGWQDRVEEDQRRNGLLTLIAGEVILNEGKKRLKGESV